MNSILGKFRAHDGVGWVGRDRPEQVSRVNEFQVDIEIVFLFNRGWNEPFKLRAHILTVDIA